MKNTLLILLSGLVLCGCSKKPAVELVVAGKNITWRDGVVLHVTKRDGTSLEGVQITTIQIAAVAANGKPMTSASNTITADTATLSPGSVEDAADRNSVQITLHNAQVHSATMNGVSKEMTLVLHR
jgi:hypothetical protein